MKDKELHEILSFDLSKLPQAKYHTIQDNSSVIKEFKTPFSVEEEKEYIEEEDDMKTRKKVPAG